MHAKPKVVFVTGTLDAGGLERFVSQVSITGKKEGAFEPVILCLSKRTGLFLKSVEAASIPVVEAPARWQRKWSALKQLGSLIKYHNPDIVHSQVNFSLLQQWVAVRFFTHAKFFVTERNCYPLQGWSLIRRVVQFHLLRLLGALYSANSIDVAKHLARMVHYSPDKIPVISNGIDVKPIDLETRAEIRTKHSWSTEDFVVGYVSRFAGHKGQDYFLSVMEVAVKQLGDRLKICFVGDGPARHKIEARVNNSSLKNQCLFLGIVENVPAYYQGFDCTTLLSAHEGMPNVVIESMAYGLPVVANPVGNVVQLFEGGAGLINYSKDPGQTAQLFVDIANDKITRRATGDRARQRIIESFSLHRTIHLLSELYGTR